MTGRDKKIVVTDEDVAHYHLIYLFPLLHACFESNALGLLLALLVDTGIHCLIFNF